VILFLFPTASRPALDPTHSPIQWVSGAPSLGLKLPEPEADHSPASSAEVYMPGAVVLLPNMSS